MSLYNTTRARALSKQKTTHTTFSNAANDSELFLQWNTGGVVIDIIRQQASLFPVLTLYGTSEIKWGLGAIICSQTLSS